MKVTMLDKGNHISKLFVVLILTVLAVTFFIFTKQDETNDFVKSVIKISRENSLVDTIKKEVSTPGALVAKIESSKAFLTKAGVFSFTNKERERANLKIFESNHTLDLIAKARLDDMFKKGYFEHVSPSGESASTVAEGYKYEYISIGENIALGNFENDEALVAAWMASPGHRANILNTHFIEMGVAVGKNTYNGKSTWIGVQIFARPLSLCIKVDDTLKNKIDRETAELDSLQAQIAVIEAELGVLSNNKQRNRDEYNNKVNEYNAIANDINSRVAPLKLDISRFNETVRAFNTCISVE